MICRHIKINEVYNFMVTSDTIQNVKLEYSKITDGTTDFKLLDGDINEIDNNLFLKQISFPEEGEYLVRVTIGDFVDYERYKIYNFSDKDTQAIIENLVLSVENMKSELNEDLLFIKKQLKIINAQL